MGAVHPKLPQALLANDNRESAVARVPADGSGVRLDFAAWGAFFPLWRSARYGTPLAPLLGFAALGANLPKRQVGLMAGLIRRKPNTCRDSFCDRRAERAPVLGFAALSANLPRRR